MEEEISRRNNDAINRHGGNLAHLTEESMRKLRVILVNKPSIPIPAVDAALLSLNRRLENPNQLTIPRDGHYPIFNRIDIDVNNEENLEERIELTLHDKLEINGTEYKRKHFTNTRESRKTIIKYTKEEQEDYKYKRVTNQQERKRSSPLRRSRDRQEKSNRKRRRSKEETDISTPSRKNYKSACDDRNCSCNQPSKSRHRSPSPQYKETRRSEKTEITKHGTIRSSPRDRTTSSSQEYRKERANPSSFSRIRSRSPQGKRDLPSTKRFERRSTHRRNISPEKLHAETRNTSPSKYMNQYGFPPHNFGYHGAQGLWLPQPHFVPGPRMSLMGGPRYFVPRPPMFIPPTFHHFRPHVLPDQYNFIPVSNESRSSKSQAVIEEPSSTSNDSCDL